MSVVFRKTSAIGRRLRQVSGQLSDIEEDIQGLRERGLSHRRRAPGSSPPAETLPPRPDTPAALAEFEPPATIGRFVPARDERFREYLAAGLHRKPRPIHIELARQRNKAIVMVIVVILLAIWVVSRFL